MHGGAAHIGLLDLGAAAVAVGKDQGGGVGVADGGQQRVLSAGHGDLVVAVLEPEVAGQPAAAGVEDLGVESGAVRDGSVGVEAEDRVLVAVGLDDRGAVEGVGGAPVGGPLYEDPFVLGVWMMLVRWWGASSRSV